MSNNEIKNIIKLTYRNYQISKLIHMKSTNSEMMI